MINKADINIMQKEGDRYIFKINNFSNLVTGKEKLGQIFVKYLYLKKYGNLVERLKLSPFKEREINEAISSAISKVKELQRDKDLSSDELLSDANLLSYERDNNEINIRIQLISQSGVINQIGVRV